MLYCFQALHAKGPKEFFFFSPANLSEDSRWGEQEKAELLWENKTKPETYLDPEKAP